MSSEHNEIESEGENDNEPVARRKRVKTHSSKKKTVNRYINFEANDDGDNSDISHDESMDQEHLSDNSFIDDTDYVTPYENYLNINNK